MHDAAQDTSEPPHTLQAVAAGVQACRRCELWRDATQGVRGEGPKAAKIMFVGEQPGDLEDLSGRPFVGPAGALFDRALADAGLARDTCYVTNAVKHFKHEMRGKRRLHKTPNNSEVQACRWWLDSERRLIRPNVIVTLGATAAKAVLGRPVSVLRERGLVDSPKSTDQVFITVHPSYLLRIPREDARRSAYASFVDDLKAAKALAALHRRGIRAPL
jgi:uracil-DNA glycosylase family protein